MHTVYLRHGFYSDHITQASDQIFLVTSAQRVLNDLKRTRLSRPSYDLASPPPPYLPSVSCLSFSLLLWEEVEVGVGVGPNPTTARKPGPLHIIRYYLLLLIVFYCWKEGTLRYVELGVWI
jgi:hypothetical protein